MDVIIILQRLLDGMKHKDRWGSIENSKTLLKCTFLNPWFKDLIFSISSEESTKNDMIELTTAIISASTSSDVTPNNEVIKSSSNADVTKDNTVSIWETIDLKVA